MLAEDPGVDSEGGDSPEPDRACENSSQGPSLLVLDLDETLIHSTRELQGPPKMQFCGFHVYLRPHFEVFLESLWADFDIAVWSAASKNYVEAIVARIFPDPWRLKFVWSGSKCTWRAEPESRESYGVKKLKKLRSFGYSLDRMIIVEDDPRKCEDNFGNAIYVPCFYGDTNDSVLLGLATFLLSFKDEPNFRAIEKRGWLPLGS
ncbi:MAG: HAD family hydrolase [Planctomycetota bacterium]|nr:HAD family hydrolase [Planctomycetota bacterium]